jgi:hypothetical protein
MPESNPHDPSSSLNDQQLAGLDALSASTSPIQHDGSVVDPEDLSIVPDLIHSTPPARRVVQPEAMQAARRDVSSIESRRTAVPIFLTTGALFFLLGLLWFTTPEDSPFREPGILLPAALIPFGLTLIGLGLMNAIEVHRRLTRR